MTSTVLHYQLLPYHPPVSLEEGLVLHYRYANCVLRLKVPFCYSKYSGMADFGQIWGVGDWHFDVRFIFGAVPVPSIRES